MAAYTAIADTGQTLVNLLRDKMCPEPVANPEYIGLCDPRERGGYVVGVHLYNVAENAEVRPSGWVSLPDGRVMKPPLSMQISYIISVVSKAELATRALDEQRILGRLAQVLADFSRLPAQYMSDTLRATGETPHISLMTLQLEDKVKIWSMFNEPYRPSLFYTIEPVFIESAIITTPAPRVVEGTLKSEKLEG